MKKFYIIIVAATLCGIIIADSAYSLEDRVCPCGYNPGGECIPCKKITNESTPPKLEDNKTFKDIQCPCGYDPGSGCIPCYWEKKKNSNED